MRTTDRFEGKTTIIEMPDAAIAEVWTAHRDLTNGPLAEVLAKARELGYVVLDPVFCSVPDGTIDGGRDIEFGLVLGRKRMGFITPGEWRVVKE